MAIVPLPPPPRERSRSHVPIITDRDLEPPPLELPPRIGPDPVKQFVKLLLAVAMLAAAAVYAVHLYTSTQ